MEPEAAHPLVVALAAPMARPRIIQLSPVLGNIYDADHFFYNPAAIDSQGPFGAVLAFTSDHGHPVVVHKCPDIYKFQGAHPTTVVCPINEVPPAIVAWGLALLSGAGSVAPAAVVQPPPAVAVAPLAADQQFVFQTVPSTSVKGVPATGGSSPLLSYKSLS
jgi:hypothetical protein